jgi:hypothetical protein
MLEKKDGLNRVIYRNINDVERFIYKYYDKSNNVKLKIRLVCREQFIEIFNKKGDLIYSDEQINKVLKMKNLIVSNHYIRIKLPKKIKEEYNKNIKTLLSKQKIKKQL